MDATNTKAADDSAPDNAVSANASSENSAKSATADNTASENTASDNTELTEMRSATKAAVDPVATLSRQVAAAKDDCSTAEIKRFAIAAEDARAELDHVAESLNDAISSGAPAAPLAESFQSLTAAAAELDSLEARLSDLGRPRLSEVDTILNDPEALDDLNATELDERSWDEVRADAGVPAPAR